ncbi:MAG TPA: hypothetical protein VIE17_10065 [Methylophilaceae bacterium]|jgi:hypothetical protein
MAISSTPVSDGIDAQSALQRRAPVPGVRGARNVGPGGEVSYVSNISTTGLAMLALDNFQSSAATFKNSNAYRTVRYLQVVAQGVVSSLNGLRDVLSQASALRNKYSAGLGQALSAINNALSGSSVNLSALQQMGVEKGSDGRFSVNTNQVIKAFNEDGAKAFSTITDFAYNVSTAAEPPEKLLGKQTVGPQNSGVTVGSGNEDDDDTAVINDDLQQRLRDAFAASVGGYTASKAVNLYSTVEAI